MTAAKRAKPRPGGSEACRAWTCNKCGAPVMRGPSGAFTAVVDPAPLTAVGELAAVLAGRQTYRLRWTAGTYYELWFREALDMRASPPGTDPLVDVVVGHQCHAPPLPRGSVTQSGITRHTAPPLPTEPPF